MKNSLLLIAILLMTSCSPNFEAKTQKLKHKYDRKAEKIKNHDEKDKKSKIAAAVIMIGFSVFVFNQMEHTNN